MKKKMVVNLMNCEKCHSEAMQIAAKLPGVESISLKGDNKSQIEVTGDGVDPVKFTCKLRRRIRNAELVSVSPAAPAPAAPKPPPAAPAPAPAAPKPPAPAPPPPNKKPDPEAAKPGPLCVCQYIPPCYAYEVPNYHEPRYCPIL